jgi:hypothetical protein
MMKDNCVLVYFFFSYTFHAINTGTTVGLCLPLHASGHLYVLQVHINPIIYVFLLVTSILIGINVLL